MSSQSITTGTSPVVSSPDTREDKELSPDYKYVIDGHRKHKFGYRLKRFQSDPGILYREGYTETQLAALNGLERVWDCGKTRYVMDLM